MMFDFEKLIVYQKAKSYNRKVVQFCKERRFNRRHKDQLQRASFSILLNIAEGTGRFTKRDRRHFYIISRGSVFECVAVFDFFKDIEIMEEKEFLSFYLELDELSKILYTLIKKLS